MSKPITIIRRDAAGKLHVSEVEIAPSDSVIMHDTLDRLMVKAKTDDDRMLLVLFADNSIARHWARP